MWSLLSLKYPMLLPKIISNLKMKKNMKKMEEEEEEEEKKEEEKHK